MAEYDTDPAAMAQNMWSPVKSVVDWHALFEYKGQDDAVKAKLLKVGLMLKAKYVFPCDPMYLYRYHAANMGGEGEDEGGVHRVRDLVAGTLTRLISCRLRSSRTGRRSANILLGSLS
jgi:hypothetical protein